MRFRVLDVRTRRPGLKGLRWAQDFGLRIQGLGFRDSCRHWGSGSFHEQGGPQYRLQYSMILMKETPQILVELTWSGPAKRLGSRAWGVLVAGP